MQAQRGDRAFGMHERPDGGEAGLCGRVQPGVPRALTRRARALWRALEAHRMRHCHALLPWLLALAVAAPAWAQDEPPARQPGAEAEAGGEAGGAGAVAMDEASLNARYAELEAAAAELVKRYEDAVRARVAALAADDVTIAYLVEKDLFSAEALMKGLPEEPLARIPWLRKTYDDVEERARTMASRFGGVTKQQSEEAAIRTLRRIARAQETYRERDSDGDGVYDYSERLEALVLHGLKETATPGIFSSNGYTFRVLHGDVLSWSGEAVPETPGKTGDRFFFIDERGKVREARGQKAGAGSPVVQEKK
jgi:hypothetical protein